MGKRVWTSAAVAALVLAACDGAGPPVPTTIVITPNAFTLQTLGETIQLTAELQDESGNPIAGTATFSWTTTNGAAVSINASGLATAVGAGTSNITASAEGVSGSASGTVDQTPADMQAAAGDGQVGEAGELLGQQVTVVLFDAGGSPVSGKTVTFSVIAGGGSATLPQANTNTQGRASTGWILGSTPGTPQTLRASVAGLTVEFDATAEKGILGVKTTALTDGRQTLAYDGRIEGRGGDGSYSFALTTGSLPSGLGMLSNGAITGTPSALGTSDFTVQVTDGTGATASRQLSLRVCGAPLSLAVGEIVETPNQALGGCSFFLPSGNSGDRYRVGVLRPSEREDGNTVVATVDMVAEGVQPSPALSAVGQMTALSAGLDQIRLNLPPWLEEDLRVAKRTEELHGRIRRAEAGLVARLRQSAGSERTDSQPRLKAAFQAMVDPPSALTLKVPTDFGSCNDGSANAATLRGFNDQLAIYQANSQMGGTDEVPDNLITQLLDYYTAYGVEVIEKFFGGVSDVNSDGRITVLITPDIDSGTAAFVWSGDFFQNTTGGIGLPGLCPDSNAQEVIYISAPFINSMTPAPGEQGASFQAVSTMVHEAKHVSSLYNRATSNAGGDVFHPSFMEEGGAEIAGEMSSRLAWAATGGPAVGSEISRQDFANAFGGGAPISPEAYGVFLRLARIVYYLSAQPNGVSGSPSSQQGGIYGSGLLFHRFIGDAYGGAGTTPMGDQSLFKNQNDPTTPGGYAGWVSVTGKTYLQLLGEYAQAIIMDGTGFEPARSFKTYDFVTATEVFSVPDPAGIFPWPVTKTCNGTTCPGGVDSSDDDNDDGYTPGAAFQDRMWTGPMGPGGIRIHEFVSNGTGLGASIAVTGSSGFRVYVARIN